MGGLLPWVETQSWGLGLGPLAPKTLRAAGRLLMSGLRTMLIAAIAPSSTDEYCARKVKQRRFVGRCTKSWNSAVWGLSAPEIACRVLDRTAQPVPTLRVVTCLPVHAVSET